MPEIPLKVLNRLRLGRDVGAEVAPREPGNRAWVTVVPLVENDAAWTRDNASDRSEYRLAGLDAREQIRGYRIARIELAAEVVERIQDDDLNPGEAEVERLFILTEAKLGTALAPWVSDASALRHPANVPPLCVVLFRLGPLGFTPEGGA